MIEMHMMVAWAAEHRPWAILPQTLEIITAVGRGEISLDAALDRVGPRAARRSAAPEQVTSGASIAVIPLRGVITPNGTAMDQMCGGGNGLAGFQQDLAAAVGDPSVKGIVLNVDSPGGQVDQVPETAAMIRAARDQKPVVAIANTMAASAAYWLAAQASEVVITPSGLAGSIGVYSQHRDVSGMQDRLGVRTTLISAGKHKVEGHPYGPLDAEAAAAMQQTVNDYYGMFLADVAAGRGVTTDAVASGYGEGRVLTAKRAVAAGLADRIDTITGAISGIAEHLTMGSATALITIAVPTADATPEVGGDGSCVAIEPVATDTGHQVVDEAEVASAAVEEPGAVDHRAALERLAAIA